MSPLTCHEVIDFLGAYFDEELAPEVRARFDEHVAVCPACVAYIDSYRKTVALARRAAAREGEGEDEGEVPTGLIAAILAATHR